MYNESRFFHERFNYIQAAETFLKLSNFQSAITAYSKAIELLPTSELFLLRAKTSISFYHELEQQCERKTKNKGIIDFLASITDDDEREKANQDLKEIFRLQVKQQNLALKDIADAILLANSFEVEKQARFERLKILSNTTIEDNWDADLTWLKHHVEGEELAKVLLVEIERIEGDEPIFVEPNEYALSLLDEILKLGYKHVDVYIKRIDAHFGSFNYGLVLKEVEKALALTDEPDKVRYILCMRGWALERMGKFKELQALAEELSQKYEKKEFTGFFGGIYKVEREILCRCAIDLEYGELDSRKVSKIRKIVNFFKASIQELEEEYPQIAAIIQKFLDSNS